MIARVRGVVVVKEDMTRREEIGIVQHRLGQRVASVPVRNEMNFDLHGNR